MFSSGSSSFIPYILSSESCLFFVYLRSFVSLYTSVLVSICCLYLSYPGVKPLHWAICSTPDSGLGGIWGEWVGWWKNWTSVLWGHSDWSWGYRWTGLVDNYLKGEIEAVKGRDGTTVIVDSCKESGILPGETRWVSLECLYEDSLYTVYWEFCRDNQQAWYDSGHKGSWVRTGTGDWRCLPRNHLRSLFVRADTGSESRQREEYHRTSPLWRHGNVSLPICSMR